MENFLEYILWLLFPQRCAVCNTLINRNQSLCEECENNIERIKKVCTVCGNDKKFCICKHKVFHFKGATSVFNHGNYSKQTVNFFKFRGNSEIGNFLSAEMLNSIKTDFSHINFDCVVPVPMHPLKKFIRGFNHSELLAKKIAKGLKIPLDTSLNKVKFGKTQHKSSFEQRRENVKGAYLSDKINAKNVLLVDDIKTTGATLDECARQLMFAGARNVYCAVAISNNFKKTTIEK